MGPFGWLFVASVVVVASGYVAVDGVTRMVDRIHFDAPLGPIGRLTERAALAGHLKRLIAIRGEYLKAEAERSHRTPNDAG